MPRMRGVAALLMGLALGPSCVSPVPPSTSPSPSPVSLASEPMTIHVYELPSLSNWLDVTRGTQTNSIVLRMVHAALYRNDASLAPVPDLAAEPCDVADDLVTITCVLRSATFHDGSPVTADDVAFVYELARSPNWVCGFVCLPEQLERVEAMDARTVRFTLTRPYAPFVSVGLSEIFIEPRALIESAYAEFARPLGEADPEGLRGLAGQIQEALRAAQPDCEPAVEAGEQALLDLGIRVADRGLFLVFGGERFDLCLYARHLAALLERAAVSSESSGIDAVAAAYPLLAFVSFNEKPVGAGPWRVSSFDPASGMTLSAHPGYHHGEPVIPVVHVRRMRDEEEIAAAFMAGDVDWRVLPGSSAVDIAQLREDPSVQLAQYAHGGFGALQYNVRAGRLFSDRNLRQAVELCIDKERTVEAGGRAVAIYSPVLPESWAYQPGLAKERNVAAGRRLIETSGWSIGEDGIYQREGRRLAAEVVVRADIEPTVSFVDRAVAQVRDCGIELTPRLVEFRDVVTMLETPPHLLPGGAEPFDAYFGGWTMAFDPDITELFHSSRIPGESDAPSQFNYIGFSDPRVDQLLDAGVATYDQERRTEIYREFQRILAEEQPYYFAFAPTLTAALDADLTSSTGDLDLSSPTWWWRLETLMNPTE